MMEESKSCLLYFAVILCLFETILSDCPKQCSMQKAENALKLTMDVMKLFKESNGGCEEEENDANEFYNYMFYRKIQKCNQQPGNCAEIQLMGFTKSGVYDVYPKGRKEEKSFQVFCDLETDGGGWTVFQRRDDFGEKQENFSRTWNEYKFGFGNMTKEFWLGNEYLHILTRQDRMSMRIEMEDFSGQRRIATYSDYFIEGELTSYTMYYRAYMGDAGDDLAYHNGKAFATFDKDNNACAQSFKGGWWYHNCHHANLNGLYLRGEHKTTANGVNWKQFKGHNYSLKRTEMKLRPEYFEDREREKKIKAFSQF